MNLLNNLLIMFCSSKKSGKGKRPGKGGNRYWKSIGLGFKTPRDAMDGIICATMFVGHFDFLVWFSCISGSET